MTARKPNRLTTITEAALAAPVAIHVLPVDEIPVVGLTVREVALSTRLPYRWLLDEINAGRVRAIKAGRGYVVPVGELAGLMTRAELQGRQGRTA